ncbi:pilus assembly protein [Clostridium thermosuccinogenes]|uniref:Pilus assembly protein n=1 Tax=Clostridium thermosuccinogenes TaxID=84032 RepID=A0A2K2FJG8_9CLOT|nr:CpaF family protein [Pseudoclostridium thermosuccinogenes]AUS98410.1 pilus assembly protein [Pseudoclostridium thermosuccinogenes]PNT98910.1 pilus assembly protein [Pseudoclostridium thermosuccinogenes]PNU00825.1 pilus assembly protein [Pseudoclostridium thermosuccinogenes]
MKAAEKEAFIKDIKKIINDSVDFNKDITDDDMKELIMNTVFERSKQQYLSIGEKQEIIQVVFNSLRRLDVLQPVVEDKTVTEIMVNGPDNIFIERAGKVTRLNTSFESRERLEDVIQSIVSKVNRIVNEASPIVDARLQDGSRVNVVLPPIALNGPIMTIRKFPEKPITMEQLIEFGSVTEEAAEALKYLVQAKYNIFISGGTGSGKTTFLNALSSFIPKDERIITIEDSAELQITGVDNIVRLETRNANTEGKGEITIRQLIKASLRMRPERIIVGEVRGAEALDMLQAMNTGHDGSLSTGHANSTEDMLSRLETMVLSAAQIPLEAIRQQIASAIDIIIHLSRIRDKSRKVMEISEVMGYMDGKIQLNPLFVYEEEGETCDKKVIGSLKRTGNKIINRHKLKMAGIDIKFL